MMIRKRWMLMVGLLVLLGWSQYGSIMAHSEAWLAEMRARRFYEEATRYRTFVLHRDKSIDFQLPANPRTLRVFTNAAMHDVQPLKVTIDDPRPGHRYCVRYEVLDQQNRVIETADYHFRARVNQYRNPETGEVFTATMFDKSVAIPAATRTLQLPMEKVAGKADRIRLRLIAADDVIEGVVARVFCCRERSGYGNPATWHRLSHERRDILARASVYTPDLLGPYERRNLLRWRWSPLAPIGVEAVDFERRTLYVLNEVSGEEITPVEAVNGVTVDASQHGVVPLPSESGMAHLQLFKRPTDARLPAEPDTPCEITVRWYGFGLEHRGEKKLQVNRFGAIVVLPCEGGLIDIASTHRAIANVSWRKAKPDAAPNDSPVDVAGSQYEPPAQLELDRRYLRTILVKADNSTTYDIAHPQNQATPFRVVVRGFSTTDEGARSRTDDAPQVEWSCPPVRWEFLDHQQRTIKTGTLAIDPTPSVYDRINMSPGRRLVTEPTEYFFNVPVNAVAVRFVVERDGALVSAATRPAELERQVMVPEEYSALLRVDLPYRTWFPIRPRKHLQLVEQNDTVLIQIQPRPPEDDPQILAGDYDWQAFQPNGDWTGRRLVVPRANKQPRPESLQSCFYELPIGETQEVKFLVEPLAEWVTPQLLYFRKNSPSVNGGDEVSLSFEIDGEKVHQQKLRSQFGEIELPRVPASKLLSSRHAKVVTDSNVVVMINYCHIAENRSFLRRTAQRIKHGRLRFEFEKRDPEELLIVKLYRPLPQIDRARLRAEIEMERDVSIQPKLAWTIRRKRFSIAAADPAPDKRSWVLGTTDETTGEGQTCFLPLGRDVPTGFYSVTLAAEDFDDGYVMLYRTRPGHLPVREIGFEPRPASSNDLVDPPTAVLQRIGAK